MVNRATQSVTTAPSDGLLNKILEQYEQRRYQDVSALTPARRQEDQTALITDNDGSVDEHDYMRLRSEGLLGQPVGTSDQYPVVAADEFLRAANENGYQVNFPSNFGSTSLPDRARIIPLSEFAAGSTQRKVAVAILRACHCDGFSLDACTAIMPEIIQFVFADCDNLPRIEACDVRSLIISRNMAQLATGEITAQDITDFLIFLRDQKNYAFIRPADMSAYAPTPSARTNIQKSPHGQTPMQARSVEKQTERSCRDWQTELADANSDFYIQEIIELANDASTRDLNDIEVGVLLERFLSPDLLNALMTKYDNYMVTYEDQRSPIQIYADLLTDILATPKPQQPTEASLADTARASQGNRPKPTKES